jgi:hypothetical protein
VFADLAKRDKSTIGRFYGFKPHLVCNDRGGAVLVLPDRRQRGRQRSQNKSKRSQRNYSAKSLATKDIIHLVTGIRSNMKNRLIPLLDHILLMKRSVIEIINDELKNICDIEHSRHRTIPNFVMNLIAALGVYCFFDKKPSIKVNFEPQFGQLALF